MPVHKTIDIETYEISDYIILFQVHYFIIVLLWGSTRVKKPFLVIQVSYYMWLSQGPVAFLYPHGLIVFLVVTPLSLT